jgi:hypothetical protein
MAKLHTAGRTDQVGNEREESHPPALHHHLFRGLCLQLAQSPPSTHHNGFRLWQQRRYVLFCPIVEGSARIRAVVSNHSLRRQSPPPRVSRANILLLLLGPSRCYAFWQEVLGCYVVNSGEGESGKKKCVPALEDYHECLHHRKEVMPIPD